MTGKKLASDWSLVLPVKLVATPRVVMVFSCVRRELDFLLSLLVRSVVNHRGKAGAEVLSLLLIGGRTP